MSLTCRLSARTGQTPLGPLDEHGIAKDYSDRLNQKHETFDVEGLADQRLAAK